MSSYREGMPYWSVTNDWNISSNGCVESLMSRLSVSGREHRWCYPSALRRNWVNMLRKYHPIWLNTHFNHPNEITEESAAACARLADAGIPLGNQSVLLRGINDCTHVMKKLVHELVKIRVRPYYIYICDLSVGIGHFRTLYRRESRLSRTCGDILPVMPCLLSSWMLPVEAEKFR